MRGTTNMKKSLIIFAALVGISLASVSTSNVGAATQATDSTQSAMAKVAQMPYKTNVWLLRANENSPWFVVSEDAISYTTVSYVKSFKTEYTVSNVSESGPSDTQQTPKVQRFETRTYYYTPINN
jgi:hypothetical protein